MSMHPWGEELTSPLRVRWCGREGDRERERGAPATGPVAQALPAVPPPLRRARALAMGPVRQAKPGGEEDELTDHQHIETPMEPSG